MTDRLLPVAWTIVVQLAAYAAGRPLVDRFHPTPPGCVFFVGRTFLAVAAGIVLLAQGALVLGALGALHAWVLVSGTAALGAVGAYRLVRAAAAPEVRASFRLTWDQLPLALAFVFVLSFLPAALGPVIAQDDSVYHLAIPKFYLAHHALSPRPFDLYANMPHVVEVLYTVAMAGGGVVAAKLLAFSCVLWTVVGIATLARVALGRAWAGVAALLYVAGRNVQWHLGTAYVEPVVGLVLLAGTIPLLQLRQEGKRAAIVMVGLASGFALGSKYPAWFYAAALTGTATYAIVRSRQKPAARAVALGIVVGVPALLLVPWVVKSAAVTGNPVYPSLYPVFGGRHWSAIQAMQADHARAAAGGLEKTWRTTLLIPWRLSAGADPSFYCPPFSVAAMLVFLVAPFLRRSYREPIGILQPLAMAGFLGWIAGIQGGRFLVAWVPVMIVSGMMAFVPLRRSVTAARVAAVLVAATAIWQLVATPPSPAPSWSQLLEDRDVAIRRNNLYEVCRYLDSEVAAGGKVLSFWENRYFFSDREVWADSSFESPAALAWLREAKDPAAFAGELRRQGFTHVVVAQPRAEEYFEDRLVIRVTDPVLYPPEALHEDAVRLDAFLGREVELRAVFGPLRVYRLLHPGGGS